MALSREHLTVDTFCGGYMIQGIAFKNGEVVMQMAFGYNPKTQADQTEEEVLGKVKQGVEASCKANNREFDEVIVGKDANLYKWNKDFEAMKPRERWMIETAIPTLTEEEKACNEAHKILRIAQNRIKTVGFKEVCPRCLGTGHFSRNARGETRCYKCCGAKHVIPKMNRKLELEIEATFQALYNKYGTWENYKRRGR